MGGDYTRIVPIYGQQNLDLDLPSIMNPVVSVKGGPMSQRLNIQQIVFMPSAYAAATITFSDSLTGKVIGIISVPATQPAGPAVPFELDYTSRGTALSLGANLNMSVSAGGAAGRLHIASYQTPR